MFAALIFPSHIQRFTFFPEKNFIFILFFSKKVLIFTLCKHFLFYVAKKTLMIMRKLTLFFLLGLILLASVVPSCTKEEITEVVNYVPIWKGSLESAPKNPAPGWAYYDTKLG